jgi:hypothetical protein
MPKHTQGRILQHIGMEKILDECFVGGRYTKGTYRLHHRDVSSMGLNIHGTEIPRTKSLVDIGRRLLVIAPNVILRGM